MNLKPDDVKVAPPPRVDSPSSMRFFELRSLRIFGRTALIVGTAVLVGDVLCQQLEYRARKKRATSSPVENNNGFSYAVASTSEERSLSNSLKEKPMHEKLKFEAWDPERSLRMFITGVFIMAPVNYAWNFKLEQRFPGSAMSRVLTKTAFSVAIIPAQICLVFTSNLLLQGKTLQDASTKIKQDLVSTSIAGSLYRSVVMLINFRFVSWQMRPVVGSVAFIMWSVFMSAQTNK